MIAALLAPHASSREDPQRPNILLFLTDDQSWCDTGVAGSRAVETPAFDRVAREGAHFTRAFAPSANCTPSRSAILTGQAMWRLEEGALFARTLPRKHPVFPEILREAGYFVGWTGKGWGPGNLEPGGWGRKNPLVRSFNYIRVDPPREGRFRSIDYAANFDEFLRVRPDDSPFFFWCGTVQPHRPYQRGSGVAAGKDPSTVELPSNLPDHPAVRSDFLDYCLDIDYADSHLARMLARLEEIGELENTLVVATSDNGIAFPRGKGNLYDLGTRVPLAVSWPSRVPGGRTIEDLVGLEDLSATFLELAGAEIPSVMTGRSFATTLFDPGSGTLDPSRDAVAMGIEGDYPVRALRTSDWLYVRNFAHETDPPREPSFPYPLPEEAARECLAAAFSKRPREELYDLRSDPWQLRDVSAEPTRAEVLAKLAQRLDDHLSETGDPRSLGRGFMVRTPPMNTDGWPRSLFGNLRHPGDIGPVLDRETLVAATDRAADTLTRFMSRSRRNDRLKEAVESLYAGLLTALSRESDPARASEVMGSSRRRFQESGHEQLAARALTDLGRLLLEEDPEAAERVLAEGSEELARIGGVTAIEELARARGLLALLALRSDEHARFTDLFGQALIAVYEGEAVSVRDDIDARLVECLELLEAREGLSAETVSWLFETAEILSGSDRPHLVSPGRLLSLALVAADRQGDPEGLAAATRVAGWAAPSSPATVSQGFRLDASEWALERGHLEECLAWSSTEPGDGSPAARHLAARAHSLAARAHAELGSSERFAESAAKAADAWRIVGTREERRRELLQLAALGFDTAAEGIPETTSPASGSLVPAQKIKGRLWGPMREERHGDETFEVRLFKGNLRLRDYRTGKMSLFEIEWQPRLLPLHPLVLEVVGGTVTRMTRSVPGEPSVDVWITPRPLPMNGALLVHEDGATSYVLD